MQPVMPTPAAATAKTAAAKPADLANYEADPDAAASALRLPGPEEALCALHAGAGRAALRRSARNFSESCGNLQQRLRSGQDRRHLLRASDGRSTPRACRSSARPRFCNCCSATSAARAAASWRCAAMRPFRVPPISPRCTTSCPATCRCRFSRRMPTTARTISKSTRPTAGVWSNFDKYFVSLLKAWYGDAATHRKRLGLRLAAARHRRSLALRLLARHGGRQDGRPVRHGPEPRRRRAECPPATHALCRS